MKKIIIILTIGICNIQFSNAQKHNDFYLNTGVGVNKIQGELHNTFRKSVVFNSGFEKHFTKNWYAIVETNFNSINYDQQLLDLESSTYLFRNTSSSIVLIGINGGYNFYYGKKSPIFNSIYVGTGFITVGEPRATVNLNVITESVARKQGAIAKVGYRFGYETKSKFLQTIFIDGSIWTSSAQSHGNYFKSHSLYVGLRMKMN